MERVHRWISPHFLLPPSLNSDICLPHWLHNFTAVAVGKTVSMGNFSGLTWTHQVCCPWLTACGSATTPRQQEEAGEEQCEDWTSPQGDMGLLLSREQEWSSVGWGGRRVWAEHVAEQRAVTRIASGDPSWCATFWTSYCFCKQRAP